MSYQMNQTEEELWERFCGSLPPDEFAGDNPETIDDVLHDVICYHGKVYAISSSDEHTAFLALREIVRKTVGV